jgi:hypothetical protein
VTAQTPIEVFAEAIERGLKLSFEPPFTLDVYPADKCPDDFADRLAYHKPRLLALLQLPFVMAYSQTLDETIFFCEDEDTKAALVEAGAEEWSIYTRAELQVLVAHNRAKPFIPDELLRLHAAKRTLGARIVQLPPTPIPRPSP